MVHFLSLNDDVMHEILDHAVQNARSSCHALTLTCRRLATLALEHLYRELAWDVTNDAERGRALALLHRTFAPSNDRSPDGGECRITQRQAQLASYVRHVRVALNPVYPETERPALVCRANALLACFGRLRTLHLISDAYPDDFSLRFWPSFLDPAIDDGSGPEDEAGGGGGVGIGVPGRELTHITCDHSSLSAGELVALLSGAPALRTLRIGRNCHFMYDSLFLPVPAPPPDEQQPLPHRTAPTTILDALELDGSVRTDRDLRDLLALTLTRGRGGVRRLKFSPWSARGLWMRRVPAALQPVRDVLEVLDFEFYDLFPDQNRPARRSTHPTNDARPRAAASTARGVLLDLSRFPRLRVVKAPGACFFRHADELADDGSRGKRDVAALLPPALEHLELFFNPPPTTVSLAASAVAAGARAGPCASKPSPQDHAWMLGIARRKRSHVPALRTFVVRERPAKGACGGGSARWDPPAEVRRAFEEVGVRFDTGVRPLGIGREESAGL